MIRRAARAWDRFWFAPADPLPLAVARIAYGAVVLVWALSIWLDLGAFYAQSGLIGERDAAWWHWSVLALGNSELAIAILYLALLVAAAGLMAGWHSRISAVVVFVAMTSFARANPYVINSGDTLLRLIAFYLALAPSGAALSLDRRRAAPLPGPVAIRAWPLRLLQIQISAMYVMAVWSKLHGEEWRDGTAASYAMGLSDLTRFQLPDVLEHSAMAAQVTTYGTLAIEGAVAVLIWNRRTRGPALVAGLLLHLSIDATIRVGFFTLAVLIAYAGLSDPRALLRVLRTARTRWPARLAGVARRRSRATAHRGIPAQDPLRRV